MADARTVDPRLPVAPSPVGVRFESLVLTPPESLVRSRSTTLSLSLVLHALMLVVVVLVPLLMSEALPIPTDSVKAFFAAPAEVALPPPPPPPAPPAAGPRPRVMPTPAAPVVVDKRFTAPIEVPDQVKPEVTPLDFGLGIEGGVPGGVEGGVPGGAVGGIVGGLPHEAPAASAPAIVRVGGQIREPRRVTVVSPEYPELARQAHLDAVIILEAVVGADGRVQDVKILRGAPLFDEPAMAAVRQWRYQPLLLNGLPTPFMLTVTVTFTLKR